MDYEDIDSQYAVPVDMISCPLCGRRYRSKVCTECEECITCHKADGRKFPCSGGKSMKADAFIKTRIL